MGKCEKLNQTDDSNNQNNKEKNKNQKLNATDKKIYIQYTLITV